MATIPSAPAGESSTDTTMAVTITLLSLTGVVTKKYASKNLLRRKNRQPPNNTNFTSLVASFPQNLSADNSASSSSPVTHVPSFPIDVSRPQPIVRWHSHLGQALSTLKFPLQLQHREAGADADEEEDGVSSSTSTRKRFIPQTCPINISLSRNGKFATLGKASIVISGDVQGESSIIVPVVLQKKAGSSKESIPMTRIKGDDLLLGLKSDSTLLHVLVSVTDAVKDVSTNKDLSYEHFLDYIIGAKSANDIRSQSLDNVVPGVSFEKDDSLDELNDTMSLSVDGSDSDKMVDEIGDDLMGEGEMQHEIEKSNVLTERSCDAKKCAHGCPALPDGNVIHEFLNAFTVGYNSATDDGEERFVAAIQATRETYPEIWNDWILLGLAVSVLVTNGIESILDENGNLEDARGNVAFACFFEQWIDFLQHEATAIANKKTIAGLLNADEYTVVSFLKKHISCTCLNEKHTQVKSQHGNYTGMRGSVVNLVKRFKASQRKSCTLDVV